MKRALVIVDVQNDFCEGGTLAVQGGAAVAGRITRHIEVHGDDYDLIVATKDWHVDPGEHFARDGAPNYSSTWPVHCEAGTEGAAFHPDLDVSEIDAIFVKGEDRAAYSGFEGVDTETGTALEDYLRARSIDAVDVAGIATDYCDRATALDAVAAGFATRLLTDLTAGVAPETTASALEELAAAGVEITTSTAGGRPA